MRCRRRRRRLLRAGEVGWQSSPPCSFAAGNTMQQRRHRARCDLPARAGGTRIEKPPSATALKLERNGGLFQLSFTPRRPLHSESLFHSPLFCRPHAANCCFCNRRRPSSACCPESPPPPCRASHARRSACAVTEAPGGPTRSAL